LHNLFHTKGKSLGKADSGPSAAYSFATEQGILAKTFRLHLTFFAPLLLLLREVALIVFDELLFEDMPIVQFISYFFLIKEPSS